MTDLAGLLADCDARGIRLHHAGDGGLTIDAPQTDLTPDMVARLKTHKDELLALLRSPPNVSPTKPVAAQNAPAKPTTSVCRCGSTTWQDVPIHDGQSVRRDCSRCGRFINFPVWYGNTTLQKE